MPTTITMILKPIQLYINDWKEFKFNSQAKEIILLINLTTH